MTVVLTSAAKHFVTPVTLGRNVQRLEGLRRSVFIDRQKEMGHIELSRGSRRRRAGDKRTSSRKNAGGLCRRPCVPLLLATDKAIFVPANERQNVGTSRDATEQSGRPQGRRCRAGGADGLR